MSMTKPKLNKSTAELLFQCTVLSLHTCSLKAPHNLPSLLLLTITIGNHSGQGSVHRCVRHNNNEQHYSHCSAMALLYSNKVLTANSMKLLLHSWLPA